MKKFLISIYLFFAVIQAWAVDTYNPTNGQLTIPLVTVGTIDYSNVVINVGKVLSIGASPAVAKSDTFNQNSGVLTIPSVQVGSQIYNNVSVTVGSIISVGGTAFNTFSVPTDISKISYPNSYITTTTDSKDIQTDPCNLDLSVVSYPKSWLGQYPLPKVTGAPANSNIQLGMFMKDIMLTDNPGYVIKGAPDAPNGCFNGSLQSEFLKSLTKLKQLGVQYVFITQWHWLSTKSDGNWYVVKAEDSTGPLSDKDLSYFSSTAHSLGLKVVMNNQIQGMVDNPQGGNVYIPPANLVNYQNWFAAFKPFMAERASFFQSIGIDIWELGCNVCIYYDWGDNTNATISLFDQNYLDIYNQIKLVFKGEFTANAGSPIFNNASKTQLASKVKYPQIGIFGQTDGKNLSVVDYKKAFLNSYIPNWISSYDSQNKTIILSMSMQSRADALSVPGYLEETGCVTYFGSLNASNLSKDCIELNTTVDFSLQAIVYEAILEGINSLNPKSNMIFAPGEYWETDSLVPQSAFPNIAASPRNKPSEGILKMWFKR